MPAKQLSPGLEARLLGAIEKTAMLVGSGSHPNDAIATAIREDGVPPSHVNLLVHAYNTGRTTRQRQDGGDVFEKAADFDLADAPAVLEKLYAVVSKTAGQVFDETSVSAAYSLSPAGLLARRELREKQAMQFDWSLGVQPPAPLTPDPAQIMKTAYVAAERLTRQTDELRRLSGVAYSKMASTFTDLVGYFRGYEAEPLPVVRENARLLHGEKAAQICDQVAEHLPLSIKTANAARHSPLRQAVGEPYALISQFLDELEGYKQAQTVYETREKSAEQRREELLRPFAGPPAPISVLDEWPPLSTESSVPGNNKTATGFKDTMQTAAHASFASNLVGNIANSIKPPDDSAVVQQHLLSLTDPNHEAKLRQIHGRSTLQDLMVNDPVIAGHDPRAALQAFNDIAEMSPRAVTQRMLLQSLMRQRLEQGHMDPFAVDQALGAENKLQKRDVGMGEGAVMTGG